MVGLEYKPYAMEMGYLFPPSLADFLGTADEVQIFAEVTERLNISHLKSNYSGMGQRPYHPLMLLRLLMWGLANRVVSTRRIEVLAHRDVSFIYLAGGQRPDYRTLARFRRENALEIKQLFQQTVILCARLGMVNLGHIALDGTKLKANTSRHKAMSYGRMKQEETRLKQEIEELMRQAEAADKEEDQDFGEANNGYNLPEELQRREQRLKKISQLREELEREKREEQNLPDGASPQIENKEQRSFADYDGRVMLMKSGGFDYGYNGQAGTEESQGVIVVADLSNEAVDMGQLPAMVEQVRELREALEMNAEEYPQTEISADSGYFSAANIRTEGEGVELLIASGREKRDAPQEPGENRIYPMNRFEYDPHEDVWRCPEGRLLTRPKEDSTSESSGYRYTCAGCGGCKLSKHCLKARQERRVLVVSEDQLLHGIMRARLSQPEKQAIYRKRKWVAEQTMGQIKGSLGFRGVTLRGKSYARAQWLFACAVHNVMKAVRFIAHKREAATKKVEATVAIGELTLIGLTL